MLSIGEFSKLTGLSQKTLIWYDNIGLLKPDFVNEENGYRFYDIRSIEKVVDIQFWQSMEFTINEIKNLSAKLVDEKIEFLREKIRSIENNIYFLQKLKEEGMNNSTIYNERAKSFSNLVCGRWRYEGSVKSLKEVLDGTIKGSIDKNMPAYLFFGEGSIGTDLIDTFGYSENTFSRFKDLEYNFFLLNRGEIMVAYHIDTSYSKNKTIKLHVYRRSYTTTKYSEKQILELLKKYSPKIGTKHFEFNKNLVGSWKMHDQILESEVKNYNGAIKTKNAHYLLSPLYKSIDITADKIAYIMEKDDTLQVKYSDNETKLFNRENTAMDVVMGKQFEGEFNLVSHNKKQCEPCQYKKVGEDEYIFANLSNDPDLDVEIHVFKKQKSKTTSKKSSSTKTTKGCAKSKTACKTAKTTTKKK